MNALHDILQPLKKRYSRIRPILILAPTPRCGSTLLQRAINQGGGAIIYGENFLMVEYAPQLLAGDLHNLDWKARATDALLDDFRRGNTGLDASAMYPPYVPYQELLLRHCYELAEFYRSESEKLGYARWGLKHQMRDHGSCAHFIRLLPDFRAVTLYRDPVAVAKSIRARWPQNLRDPRQCQELGRRWRDNLRFLLKLDRSRNLVVSYEDLVSDQERQIARIESHLELKLSREAFAKRVNAHTREPDSAKPGEIYLPPAELPAQFIGVLARAAEPFCSHLGYRSFAESSAQASNSRNS